MPDDNLIVLWLGHLGKQFAQLFHVDFKAAVSLFCNRIVVDREYVDVDYFRASFLRDYSGTGVLANSGVAGDYQLQQGRSMRQTIYSWACQ